MNTVDRQTPPGVIVTFLASASGVGRTGAVANVAWILAAAGKSVLIIDLSTDGAGAHSYLAPFHNEWVTFSRATTRRLADLMVDEPNLQRRRRLGQVIPTQVRRYLLPGARGRIESIAVEGGETLLSPSDEGLLVTYRNLVRASGYEYVLIDAPTDLPAAACQGAARVSDVVVTCFTIRRQAVEAAAAHARTLRDGLPRPPYILAVPTQLDDRDPDRIADSRRLLRQVFEQVVDDFGTDVVEIPYFPIDAYDRRLAVLMDDTDTPGSPCGAYHRLTRAVTRGEVGHVPAVDTDARMSYRRALGMAVPADAGTLFVAYAPRDRAWADWIAAQVRLAGADVRRLTGDEPSRGRVIAVMSPSYAGPHETHEGEVVRVRVAGPGDARDAIDLRGQSDEDGARALLLNHLWLIPDPRGAAPTAPAFPGGPDPVRPAYRLPARNPSFVGRDDELEAIRDRFDASDDGQYVLSGPAGVGKSEIAREYSHRFARDYAVIWWISAHSRERSRQSLQALGDRLQVRMEGDPVQSALGALRVSARPGRWLLIYDNADDLADVDGLLPTSGGGDVLITTRDTVRDSAPVTAFDAEESVALLRAQVPAIRPDDARGVADAVEHLPFSLRLAAAWLREMTARLAARAPVTEEATAWAVTEFHAQLQHLTPPAADTDHPPSAAACLTLSLRALDEEEHGPLTRRLVELCAFLSPEEIGLHLLCSAAMLDELLVGEAARRDEYAVHQVIWLAVRYGLAEVDWVRRASLRSHRLAHSLVRAALGPDEATERREQVLRALAAYAPGDADGTVPDHLPVYRELQRHLEPSGALESDHHDVRRWVIGQLGYTAVTGDMEAIAGALELAEKARARWARDAEADDVLPARLMSRTADLRRALGDNAGALELDDAALGLQRRNLGLTHPSTLISGRGRGGTLRGMGRFAEALAEDQTTWTGFRASVGEEHPDALLAAHNLAVSTYLTGDQRAALRIGRATHRRRKRLYGPEDHRTLGEVPNLGIYLRDLGLVEESLQELREAWERTNLLEPRRARLEVRLSREFAVTLRHTDDVASAYARTDEALRRYTELLGEDHPDTLACKLSLAIAADATGNTAAAVELGTACVEAYDLRMGPDHPFSHVARLDLGLFLLAAGDLDRAAVHLVSARDGLAAELGEQHPWSVAAAIGHAGAVAETDRAAAARIEEDAFAASCDFLGPDHPTVEILKRRLAGGTAAGHDEARPREYVAIDVLST